MLVTRAIPMGFIYFCRHSEIFLKKYTKTLIGLGVYICCLSSKPATCAEYHGFRYAYVTTDFIRVSCLIYVELRI